MLASIRNDRHTDQGSHRSIPMTSHEMARVVCNAINAFDSGVVALPSFTAELRLRSFRKISEITDLSVHVLPLPEETTIDSRDGDVIFFARVGVAIVDRIPAGGLTGSVSEFDWMEIRQKFVHAILDVMDWPTVLASSKAALSEAEIDDAVFEGADAEIVFASFLSLTFE